MKRLFSVVRMYYVDDSGQERERVSEGEREMILNDTSHDHEHMCHVEHIEIKKSSLFPCNFYRTDNDKTRRKKILWK